jgi:hypothetical protein
MLLIHFAENAENGPSGLLALCAINALADLIALLCPVTEKLRTQAHENSPDRIGRGVLSPGFVAMIAIIGKIV